MNILLTGASGFIGTRLLKLLDKPGNQIRIISRRVHSRFETIVCDFEQDMIPVSALKSVDIVFHLAGFAHDFRDGSQVQNIYKKINVNTTVQLAKLAIHSGVQSFVFVSSVKAGGSLPHRKCMNEEDQAQPDGVYGETKREAELQLIEIISKSNMHLSIVRPSLVYGPNVKGNLHLMLTGIKKGWFPPLPETGNRRSMIHVDDLVMAILLVSEDKRANGEIFIATDGAPYSSREIYDTMCNISGKLVSKWRVPKLLFDMASLTSPRIKYKINKLLGDEHYSSAKLKALGFKVKKSLKDMNETDF